VDEGAVIAELEVGSDHLDRGMGTKES
jgi:hypothetical protein